MYGLFSFFICLRCLPSKSFNCFCYLVIPNDNYDEPR